MRLFKERTSQSLLRLQLPAEGGIPEVANVAAVHREEGRSAGVAEGSRAAVVSSNSGDVEEAVPQEPVTPPGTWAELVVKAVSRLPLRIRTFGFILFSTFANTPCYQHASSCSPKSAAKRTPML